MTTSSRHKRLAAASLLAGLVLLVAALPGARSATPGDPNDVEGPLDLAEARVDQQDRHVKVTIRVHDSLPPLRELSRFPSRVGATDERYLCLQVESRRHGRRLYCPAGKVRHRRIGVGVSSYGDQGAARKRDRLRAGIRRQDPDTVELTLPLSQLGPGRIRWAALSGWSGDSCVAGGGPRRHGKRRKPRGEKDLCADRLPDAGLIRGRLRPLQRVGCSVASPLVHRAGSSRGRRIALTFDDGPSPYTKRVLGILDRAGAKGTFFVVGSEVPGDTSELRRALAHGHELGNHSLNHELHPSSASLRATSDRIRAATGFTPCTFRPPYGDYNSGTVAAAQANGMSTVIWDVDPKDWSLPGSSSIYSRVVAGAHPGAIIIMHDGGGPRGQTVAALPRIIATLQSRGYDLVTVTKLLGERFRSAVAG